MPAKKMVRRRTARTGKAAPRVRKRKPTAKSVQPIHFLRGESTYCEIGDKKIAWLDLLAMIPGYDPFYGITPDQFYFDTEAAQHVISFFSECLVLTEGKVKPFVPEFWQAAILACLFGWKDASTGWRRYRKVFLYIARKNGKSPLVAGIMLYVLLCDGEPGCGLVVGASTREQASVTFKHASAMVLKNSDLNAALRVYKSHKSIQRRDDDLSVFKVLSSDGGAAHGGNIHFGIVEELHAHSNLELVEAIESAQGSRDQPVVFYVTTADFMRDSLCNRKLRYSKQVRDKQIDDPTYLPIIYETLRVDPDTGRDIDWRNPSVWYAANPNLGVSVTLKFLQDECKEAQHDPFKENTFKRLYLNMQTESASRLFNMFDWDKCFVPSPIETNSSLADLADLMTSPQRKLKRRVAPEMHTPESRWNIVCPPLSYLVNEKIDGVSTDRLLEKWFRDSRRKWIRDLVWYAGADFSSVRDITALVMFSPEKDPWGQYPVIPFMWFPSANAEKRTYKDGHPYINWLEHGFMFGTPNDYIDPNAIIRCGIRIYEYFGLQAIAFDRWGSDSYYANWDQAGIECVRFGQGFGDMDGPINTLFRLVGRGELGHGGHPVLRWMAGNCTAEQNKDGRLRINKQSCPEKVDGVLGLAMALGLAAQRHPELELFSQQTELLPLPENEDSHDRDSDDRRSVTRISDDEVPEREVSEPGSNGTGGDGAAEKSPKGSKGKRKAVRKGTRTTEERPDSDSKTGDGTKRTDQPAVEHDRESNEDFGLEDTAERSDFDRLFDESEFGW